MATVYFCECRIKSAGKARYPGVDILGTASNDLATFSISGCANHFNLFNS